MYNQYNTNPSKYVIENKKSESPSSLIGIVLFFLTVMSSAVAWACIL